MKRQLALLIFLTNLCIPAVVSAAQQDVLITEIQTETVASASEEYITIANNSDQAIDITGWHLQYFSATAASFNTPSRNIALAGTLAPHDIFMAASTGYRLDQADVSFGASLAAPGGHIRLVSGVGETEVQHDLVGWGTAIHPEAIAAVTVAKGQSYSRKKDTNGFYIDSDNNARDFGDETAATGQTPGPEPTENEVVAPGIVSVSGAPSITELLPDPAAPTTDANGEFVELHNPNQETIDLTGYKLQTGTNFTYSYTFKSGSLGPGAYQAFYAPATKLTLSNSSGQARLVDPDGAVVSETAAYGKAPTGSSWMLFGENWAWTGEPTPGVVNGAAITGTGGSSVIKAASKKASSAKAKVAAKAKASTAKSKAAKISSGTAPFSDYKDPAKDGKALPVSPLLLAVVGVPLIGYMVYEYRQDLGNFFTKLRRNRSIRREARPIPSGR